MLYRLIKVTKNEKNTSEKVIIELSRLAQNVENFNAKCLLFNLMIIDRKAFTATQIQQGIDRMKKTIKKVSNTNAPIEQPMLGMIEEAIEYLKRTGFLKKSDDLGRALEEATKKHLASRHQND